MFAGRLVAQKGIDVLLEALSLLEDSDLVFDVVLHGSGGLERDVAAAVTRLRRRVELLPSRHDLAGRLRSFDAIVMPSRFEGLPMLVVEALCAGVPVLATNAPGLDEALPDWYPGRCAVATRPHSRRSSPTLCTTWGGGGRTRSLPGSGPKIVSQRRR